MKRSKVVYYGEVLIDLTEDSITADNLLSGITAHDKAGEPIVGTMTVTNYYVGSGAPPSSLGNDGDIYFQID